MERFPLYVLTGCPLSRRSQRDPPGSRSRSQRDPPKRTKGEKVTIYRLALRKERTISVATAHVMGAPEAATIAHGIIGDSPYEKLLTLLVNNRNRVVGAVIVATSSSIGSVTCSIRGIFAAAIQHNAAGIILAHNHPSGSKIPSREDLEFALAADAASKIVQIPILDHLIITQDPDVWASFTP